MVSRPMFVVASIVWGACGLLAASLISMDHIIRYAVYIDQPPPLNYRFPWFDLRGIAKLTLGFALVGLLFEYSRAARRKRTSSSFAMDRWRYQYSLKGLLLAVFLAALAMTWVAARVRAIEGEKSAKETILKLGGKLVGTDDDVFHVDLRNTNVADSDLSCLPNLPRVCKLDLSCTRISDAGLVHLAGLVNLTWLNLSKTRISDEGLRHLRNLRGLGLLDVSGDGICGTGLRHLVRIRNLTLVREPVGPRIQGCAAPSAGQSRAAGSNPIPPKK